MHLPTIRGVIAIAALALVFAPRSNADQQLLYVAANERISVFQMAAGKLQVVQRLPLAKAGPFTTSPNRDRMYVVTATEGAKPSPAIATLKIANDGRLALIHLAACELRAGYLRTDRTGSYLAGNHYGPGKATLWKLKSGVYHGESAAQLTLDQGAHCAVFSPDNRWLLVCATTTNKVFVHRFEERSGSLRPHTPPFFSGPSDSKQARQPRHLIFHPSLKVAYTTNERERPGVGVWHWDETTGTLKLVQTLVTQPESFAGRMTTADLHITPNGRFLFVSNRDLNDRKAKQGSDSIALLKVDPSNGQLKLMGHQHCERIPRSFTIDATGRYLYVSGQGDGKLGAYQIDQQSGNLKRIAQYELGGAPIWVETIQVGE